MSRGGSTLFLDDRACVLPRLRRTDSMRALFKSCANGQIAFPNCGCRHRACVGSISPQCGRDLRHNVRGTNYEEVPGGSRGHLHPGALRLRDRGKAAPVGFAGMAIGITLVVIHIFCIHITGVSVNPARSLGPALLVGGKALGQVWLFLLVPSLAGILAGLPFRMKALEADFTN